MKLPSRIYVKYEPSGVKGEPAFLLADTIWGPLVDNEGTVEVGTYVLENVSKLKKVVQEEK